MGINPYSEITDEILHLTELSKKNNSIEKDLYIQHKVNRGLRDMEGNGVLTGLTEISDVVSSDMIHGKKVYRDGELYYRGYRIDDIVNGFISEDRFGFEETIYLLLFGELPSEEKLKSFNEVLMYYRSLPTNFVRDIILKAPSPDMMNVLARSVLTMFSYDDYPNDTSLPNVLRQCLQLISLFPLFSVYGYHSYNYYHGSESLVIHPPKPEYSIAQNFLHMLRPDNKFSDLEAKILDVSLVLHAEHGGGNNSTFTTHVVTSSGTDTYSAMAAALGSLKGPKHGGANIKVVSMFDDMKLHVKDLTSEGQVADYLTKLIKGKVFDKSGLIYGIGHAVYAKSDPRANIFKGFVEDLSEEKGRTDEFKLYTLVERLAPEVVQRERTIYKGVSANVDFYSGFVYSMMDLPVELYTPIFATARISGWSAHRMEELINSGKIIRPAYMNVLPHEKYVPLEKR